MASIPQPNRERRPIIELETGNRMTREEFHGAYEQTPEDFKAELIAVARFGRFGLVGLKGQQ